MPMIKGSFTWSSLGRRSRGERSFWCSASQKNNQLFAMDPSRHVP
jgi:hypothetical protein